VTPCFDDIQITGDGDDDNAQPRCNHADGYELTASEDDSTDIDSDLDYTVWYVDGVVRSSGYVIPLGNHTIDLLAVDDRGAYDFLDAHPLRPRGIRAVLVRHVACLAKMAASSG
jgi:hypothetical protein